MLVLVPALLNAGSVVLPALPPSSCPDTEVTTNVAFNAVRNDVRSFDVRLELTGTVSNCVEIAFGCDSDGDGCLALEETELSLGWRCGRYCVENVPESLRLQDCNVSTNDAGRFLQMHVETSAEYIPSAAGFENETGPCFAGLSETVPGWLCRTDWNLMRVTRRGPEAATERCVIDCGYRRFIIRIR